VSLHAKGVDLFLQSAGARYIDAARPAMFQMLGVFAEFERAMIRERVMAGLSRAKADGIQLGRRRLEATDADKVAPSWQRAPGEQGSAGSLASWVLVWERCYG